MPLDGITISEGTNDLGNFGIDITDVKTFVDKNKARTFQVNGSIVSDNPEYFSCFVNSSLEVKVYEFVFNSDPLYIQSPAIDSENKFSDEVLTTAQAILVRVYLTGGSDGPVLLSESQKFCHHENINLELKVDESLAGDTVFNKVIARLDEAGASTDEVISGLTTEQIDELACLTCVTSTTLKRIKLAYQYWDLFAAMVPFTLPDGYDDAGTAAHDLVNEPDTDTATVRGRKLFFALLKDKTGNDVGDVFTYSTDQFTAALQNAIDKNEIESALNSETNVGYLTGSRDALLLNATNDAMYYDAKLIHLSDNSYADKSDLLNRALDNGGLIGITPSSLGDVPLEHAMDVKTLNAHLRNFIPFVKAVVDDRGADLDYFALASLGPDEWEALMTSSADVPSDYADAAAYAADIFSSVGSAEPSGRMIYNLSVSSSLPSAGGISTALNDHPDFNIGEHSAAVYFTTDLGHSNTIDADVMNDMLALQRTAGLTGDTVNLDNTAVLFGADLTSANAIANMGEEPFLRSMAATGMISDDSANRIWARASANNNAVQMMAWNYLRYESPGALMPRLLRQTSLTLPGGALPEGLPDMSKIFGSFDTCTCSDCQSVYSASAYLTDLLNWLRKDVIKPAPSTVTGFTALETLGGFDRRKDIRYILLTCQNTNTLLPYINIVNEILSVELLADTGASAGVILAARQSLQTTKTTEEIMVEPEHRFTASEDLLKNYSYPWMLSYDVAYDEVLSFTKVSGMEYHEVVTAFSPGNLKYDEIRWARTFLNINYGDIANPQELGMFTGTHYTSTTFWTDYWGFSGAIAVPPTVGPVIKATGLSITELKEMLHVYYLNGTSEIAVLPVDDLCDVDSYTFSPSFTAAVAERFMKFSRLKSKTGLSIWELDVAIETLGGGTIDNNFLQRLAACISFTKDHKISFSDLLVMMGDNTYYDLINTTDFSEYYNSKFLNPLLPEVVRTFFAAPPYAANVNLLTNEQKHYLSITLKVSIPAIDEIIGYLLLTGPFTALQLQEIHRHALLLNVFGIDHTELIDSVIFFGDIFGASNKIKTAYEFSEALANFRKLKVPLLKFKDIAEGTGDYTLINLDAKAEKSWTSVEKVFQKARKANPDLDSADPLNYAFYIALVLEEIALQFDLIDADIEDVINEYDATWLNDFIDDADGTGTARTWTNKKTAYKPVYRLLNRIAILCGIFKIDKTSINELEKQTLVYAIETEIDATMDVPGTAPFYWLKDDYTALTATSLKELVWIYNASQQASLLDMPQRDLVNVMPIDFYTFTDDYFNNSVLYVTGLASPINDLYDALGDNSSYKKLSIHEFTAIFIRAKEIALVADDLVSTMEAFAKIYNVTQVFNIKAADAWGWIWSAWTGGTFTATSTSYLMSADIKRAMHSKYPALSTWSDVIVPVQNGLRGRMRDAFVGLYIARRGFANENELYFYYLLDTQMAPCMKTSRIVQAISSVQLLVHRALLNLEADVYMDDNDKQEWQWRKNYRVWEANRKVFLYPENWIDPTLRKNKTELFKAAEDLLQQDDINDRNCEQAFAGYLTGLNDVAHLDTRAIYVEDPEADLAAGEGMVNKNSANEIYHVFARNWNAPYIYYYRKCVQGVWTGWEKMDIEIDSDHLIPVMFNRKIYLFFPVFQEKVYLKPKAAQDETPYPYYEIQLCYTKYDFGKWSQKKMFKEKLYSGPTSFQSYDPTGTDIPGRIDEYGWAPHFAINNFSRNGADWFALASMSKSDYYFWAENLSNGGLKIHTRRAFNPKKRDTGNTYTEFAFDLNFQINQVDERVDMVGGAEINNVNETTTKFYLARPYMTMPYFQQMKFGKAVFKQNDPAVVLSDYKMLVKSTVTSDPDPLPLLGNASDYILTYPQQYKHNIKGQTFFFKHPKRSYIFRFNGQYDLNNQSGSA